LKTEINLNYTYKHIAYLTEGIVSLQWKGLSVNDVQGNNDCLWEPYGTHKHTVWANWNFQLDTRQYVRKRLGLK